MTIRTIRTALVAVTVAGLTACGAGLEPPAAGGESTSAPAPSTTAGETTMTTRNQDQLPIVAPAVDDLARRLGVSTADIDVVSAEEVTWPDGSLGCPEPGMSYTQALVDGSRVILRHEDRVYVYHAGDDGRPFLCPSEEKDGGHDFIPPPGFGS